jgi:hypothetical protein
VTARLRRIARRHSAPIRTRDTRRTLWVNVYELDRMYGGPEEGGWWFTTGWPVSSRRLGRTTHTHAASIADRVSESFDNPARPLSSIAYDGGQMSVQVETHPARGWPRTIPYYC